jgi:hypothetical protein
MKSLKLIFLSGFFLSIPFNLEASNGSNTAEELAPRFAQLALSCIHKEFPNVVKHMMAGPEHVKTPKSLYPAFYGCFDWHSSVHGHWLLVRLLNQYPSIANRQKIINALSQSFSEQNIKGELAYFNRPKTGTSFERPYGLAWFLQLTTELRQWQDPLAKKWLRVLQPLEEKIVANIAAWLPKLAFPIRVGEHSQTAFAFGLMLDWSLTAKNNSMEKLLTQRINYFYLKDVNCPLAYEPSGQDFLSPCIAEADLMRRVMTAKQFAHWLSQFLPTIPTDGSGKWLTPATVVEKSDGKLAHLDGLNLSRAWMLQGVASALSENDARRTAILKAAKAHRKAGVDSVVNDLHYMGSHWLGSFATYLETQRGF